MGNTGGLSVFQRHLLTLVFQALPTGTSFALAGGGALIARGLSHRTTEDLDLFTSEERDVKLSAARVEAALAQHGLNVTVVRAGASFRRMLVEDPGTNEHSLLDLGWDARLEAASETDLGPTLTVRELVADKVLALFGRAEPRDLVDLYALSDDFDEQTMLDLARAKDPGFDVYVFAQMLAMTADRPDIDFPMDADGLARARDWARRLRTRLARDLLG